MLLKQVLEAYELIDRADANGARVADWLSSYGASEVAVQTVTGDRGSTDFVSVTIAGRSGRVAGGNAPTLGVLGRLGGLGARPEVLGMVSDGDGALVALAVAGKLLDMAAKGDVLAGDVVVKTHICPDAPVIPHEPTPFMDSPVDMATVNALEVDGDLDAILSVDTTKGNRVINHRGFAISPTVRRGYILRTSEDLLAIMSTVTGQLPKVFPLTQQDITPYGNDVYHLNSILQPATATDAPVVGVALVTETPVAGSASGASHFVDIEACGRFVLEVAKAYGRGSCAFFDADEFARLERLYGELTHFQTLGREVD